VHFQSANLRAEHTQRHTDTQITLRATSVAIDRIYALRALQGMQPKNNMSGIMFYTFFACRNEERIVDIIHRFNRVNYVEVLRC